MSDLNPEKLHVTFHAGTSAEELRLPRRYTLTHSDFSGDLFLSIGPGYDHRQIAGFYTRLMRDEVLAELKDDGQELSLHVYCHVSGGIVFGTARMRNGILHQHMRMVLEALRCGEEKLVAAYPGLGRVRVWVHFLSNRARYNRVEDWGLFQEYG
jgi:magnesium dechelatase